MCGPRGVARDPGHIPMTPSDPIPALALRPREAALALGISPRLLWQLTKDGHIPHKRIGHGKRKTILYSVAELRAWLRSGSAPADEGVDR